MSSKHTITKPIYFELKKFNKSFASHFKLNIPLLNYITTFVVKNKSSQFRPILIFLIAKHSGTITDSTYTAATLAELMYTSKLIHNDVKARDYKRGLKTSFTNFWNSKVSVLLGDLILSKGLLMAMNKKEYKILESLSLSFKDTIESNLLKQKFESIDIVNKTQYQEYAFKNSISFISSCIKSSVLSNNSGFKTDEYDEFSYNFGMSFQIKKDLEYVDTNFIKKQKSGNHAVKLLYPVILAIEKLDTDDKVTFLNLTNKYYLNKNDIRNFIGILIKYDIIHLVNNDIQHYLKKAFESLDKEIEVPIRNSLKHLINNYL